jgi:phosphatidylethanolamine N-methyltransferase
LVTPGFSCYASKWLIWLPKQSIVFKVPTTHDVLTLFHPGYPKSHFDILSLFLLGSQLVIFFYFLYAHQKYPESHQQGRAKTFFVIYFAFWRAMYNAGLGWVLTKQSKKRWIVNMVVKRGWFDQIRLPKVRAWLRKQLEGKMGKDYAFDVSVLAPFFRR